jgi:hypothetical protein
MKSRTIIRTMRGSQSPKADFAIRSEREYDLALQRLRALAQEIGDNLENPRYGLIEALSVAIDAYDSKRRSAIRGPY